MKQQRLMQTTIYAIRHGEVHNPQKILYARLPNFGLSEKGKKEAELTGEFLKDKEVDMLYTSPLQRAKETAAIIQKVLQLPTIHVTEEITEVRTSYQGRKFAELDELQSEVYLKPLSPDDETIEQIGERTMRFINYLCKTYPGKQIAFVSHGDPIMAAKAMIQNKTLDFIIFKSNYIQHGEIYQITNDDEKYSLVPVFKPIV